MTITPPLRLGQRLLVRIARLILGGAFLWACAHKIADPSAFALSIFRFHVVPHALINGLALVLPWVECLAGAAVLLAPSTAWRRSATLALLAVLILYTGGLLSALARGIDLSCGCFSSDPSAGVAGWMAVGRNLGLMLLAAGLL